jgi:hypothetical protein
MAEEIDMSKQQIETTAGGESVHWDMKCLKVLTSPTAVDIKHTKYSLHGWNLQRTKNGLKKDTSLWDVT